MTSSPAGRATSAGAGSAAPRSRLYRAVRTSFRYPDEDFFAALASGAWLETLSSARAALPFEAPPLAGLNEPPPDLESAQVEFSRLFDVGPGGPPCSLFGGHYESDRLRIMEEASRFYEFFGLRFDREVGIFPDHIAVEMEFMEYLAGRPSDGSYLRAQRDFLDRHLARWLPQLARTVNRQAELPFYRSLVDFAAAFVEADRRYLLSVLRQPAE